MTIFKNLNTFFSMSTMETILIYMFHTGLDIKGAICVTANFNCLKIQVESTSLCIQLIFYKSLCQIIISLKDLRIQWSFWLNSTPILNFNMHTRPYISILKCYFEYTFRMIFHVISYFKTCNLHIVWEKKYKSVKSMSKFPPTKKANH